MSGWNTLVLLPPYACLSSTQILLLGPAVRFRLSYVQPSLSSLSMHANILEQKMAMLHEFNINGLHKYISE